MKFYAYCCNKSLEDNNGGSLVLWHHLHALEELGHESGGMINLNEAVPKDADYIMFQSEWWASIRLALEMSNAKRICWLGTYDTGGRYAMPRPKDIKADYYHTQYKGACVKWGEEQIGQKIYYLPHAGCHKCNTQGRKIESPKVIFICNHFPERSEEWLDKAQVTKMQVPFNKVKDYYASAIVCPNIHGGWQKGETTEFFQIPGEMINERIFQIILSGGFAISDNTPIVKDFFTEEEVPQAKTPEEFKSMIEHFKNNPQERLAYMERAKKNILNNHLYIHRWRNWLSELGLTGNTKTE